MKRTTVLGVACVWVLAFAMRATAAGDWPAQLEVSALPSILTPFEARGRIHIAFEVYLRNFASDPADLQSVEVLDAADDRSIAVFAGQELASMIEPVGRTLPEGETLSRLPAGSSDIVFMWVSFDRSSKMPRHIRLRVRSADNYVVGPALNIGDAARVLSPPLSGANWQANDAFSNDADNHHRRGVLILNGRPVDSRRFATDWVRVSNGATYVGNVRETRAYLAYAQPVFAVADARVVSVKDGLPDNLPGHNAEFHPSIPITMATVVGNRITLDLGNGQFAHYFHLRARSLLVKAGDKVRRGQRMAEIGSSGDAREPHLHFEVTASAEPIFGDGLPYVIDRYEMSGRRAHELPLRADVVDFGEH